MTAQPMYSLTTGDNDQVSITINDRTTLIISAKGVPVVEYESLDDQILSIPLFQICGFVQNTFQENGMTIYFKKQVSIGFSLTSVLLPRSYETMNGRVCGTMVRILNSMNSLHLIPRYSCQFRFTDCFMVLRVVSL